MKKTKMKIVLAVLAFAASIAWICIILNADVGKVGPKGKEIGLSLINSSFHDIWHYDDVGYNKLWYGITQAIGGFSLAVAAGMGLFGLIQLIKRKSLFKVDKCIIVLGILYAVTFGVYLMFEFVIINYRPLIMPGETEPAASFPSSHTMLTIVIMGSMIVLLKNYIKKTSLRISLQFTCLVLMLTMVLGRFICGVHWFSDVIGGILIGLFLVDLYWIFGREDK